MGKISYYVLKHVSFLPILWLFAISIAQAQQTLTIDAAKVLGQHSTTPLNTVGAGRANEGLRADWQAQLATIQQDIGFHHIRFHGLLHDDMGVYNEDSQGNAIYNFQYVDALYDELLRSTFVRSLRSHSCLPSWRATPVRSFGGRSTSRHRRTWRGGTT